MQCMHAKWILQSITRWFKIYDWNQYINKPRSEWLMSGHVDFDFLSQCYLICTEAVKCKKSQIYCLHCSVDSIISRINWTPFLIGVNMHISCVVNISAGNTFTIVCFPVPYFIIRHSHFFSWFQKIDSAWQCMGAQQHETHNVWIWICSIYGMCQFTLHRMTAQC